MDDPSIARAMANIICRYDIDAIADDPDLPAIIRLLERKGYSALAIQHNLTNAITMARIRQSNEQRKEEQKGV